MREQAYDIVVIGGGSAGLTGAAFAARLGARVALVEKEKIGGDCTWSGCVPSKALIKAAKVAQEIRTASRFGITSPPPRVDMAAVRQHVRGAIQAVYQFEQPDTLRKSGIAVIAGAARFVDAHTLDIDGQRTRGKFFLIATGASPAVPPIEGLGGVPYLTYQSVFDLDRVPRTMIVVGAGPIGMEMAQVFQRLGSEVTVIGRELLPRDEPEVRELMKRVFEKEGIRFVADHAVSAFTENDVAVIRTSRQEEVRGEVLLLASGRRPSTANMDLEAAGVLFSERGIPVDGQFRSNIRHIYAAGDVTGGHQFTHLAGWQAFHAVRNALLPGHSDSAAAVLPWTTFTDPEVAHVGMTEEEARAAHGARVGVHRWPMSHTDRAICEGETDGFIKVAALSDGTILGGTIAAPRAGEMIAELALAMQNKLKLRDVAGTIHPYPTYSTPMQQLASDGAVAALLGSTAGKLLTGFAKWIR